MKLSLWPRPSTRAFMREARRTPGYSLLDWLHGYIYARWPYLYIGIGTGEHPLPGARNRRGPAGCPHPQARGTACWGRARRGRPSHRRLRGYLSRQGRHPRDGYPSRAGGPQRGPGRPGAGHPVCAGAGHHPAEPRPHRRPGMSLPERGRAVPPARRLSDRGRAVRGFIAEHQPQRSRWITGDEAAEILQAEHARGHVHHAFFKDAMLGRFYAICNCCSCCCGAMQAHRNGVPMLAASGYVSQVDEDLAPDAGSASRCVSSMRWRWTADGRSWTWRSAWAAACAWITARRALWHWCARRAQGPAARYAGAPERGGARA